ncbi:hypothetical protein GGQ84_002181 [Desulfitispora alkaliphila]|uniref:DUF2507 domain-containing protein n=1 Tax=Desulfitispora alkaliphila TaxID=622674 RepID=UPI003D1A748C
MEKVNLSDLGSITRPTLGSHVPLDTFRLLRLIGMQEILGESTGPTLYMVGKRVGKELNLRTLDEFLIFVKKYKIGIPKVTRIDNTILIVQVQECMTCAGLPDLGKLFCDFESGLIAGAMEAIYNKNTKSTQTKSFSNGDGYCEFEIFFY